MLKPLAESRTFGVNVISHFWLIQAFLPGMIAAGKGHIVSVASLLGITGNTQLSEYSVLGQKSMHIFIGSICSRLLRLQGRSDHPA